MRTLHADLEAAQKSASRTPYITINFLSRDGATSRTYSTTDSPNRIVFVSQVETRQHTNTLSSPQGNFSAIIRLRDPTNAIGGLDFEGYRVRIRWGLNTTSGNKVSDEDGPPVFVYSKRRISTPQDIYVEFMCISLWELTAFSYLNNTGDPTKKYIGSVEVRHILMDLLAGGGATVLLDDGGVFTDLTTTAVNYNTAGELTCLPATPVTNDALYIGSDELFDRITFDMVSGLSGSNNIVQEYWNGSAWRSIFVSGLEEYNGTDDWDNANSGLRIHAWQMPSDWATTSVNGITKYWTRWRYAAGTGTATANRLLIGRGLALEEDTASITGLDFTPNLETAPIDTVADLVEHILRYTKAGIYARNEGFHIREVDNAQTAEDYTYDTADVEHVVFESAQHDTTILPNKFLFTDIDLDDVASAVEGEAEYTDSINAWGTFRVPVIDPSVTSASVGNTLADRLIQQRVTDRSQGYIFAKMNCGQEVWDWVRLEDSRISSNFEGRVTRITRVFEPGAYVIELELGNYITGSILSPEDLLRWVQGVTPQAPLVLSQIPATIRQLSAIFTDAKEILQQQAVGGLTDLGPTPTEEAVRARQVFQSASFFAARIVGELERIRGGLGFIREIEADPGALEALEYGEAGVAPIYDFRTGTPDRAFTGYVTPDINRVPPEILNIEGSSFTRYGSLTPRQRQFLIEQVPSQITFRPGFDRFTRIGRVAPFLPGRAGAGEVPPAQVVTTPPAILTPLTNPASPFFVGGTRGSRIGTIAPGVPVEDAPFISPNLTPVTPTPRGPVAPRRTTTPEPTRGPFII